MILVRRETTPDDYHGMIAAQGILTSAGGTNSHAAVVARGEGIPAVCGADQIKLDAAAEDVHGARHRRSPRATSITIDGFTGKVFVGELPLAGLACSRRRGRATPRPREQPIWSAFERLMTVADARRRLRVRANADTPDQSTNARDRGAEGHRPVPHRAHVPRRGAGPGGAAQMIFAETPEEEQVAYDALLPLQRDDFVGHLPRDGRAAGDGAAARPAAARVPARPHVELSVEVALGKARGRGRRPSRNACSEGRTSSTRRTRCSACAACAWAS